MKTIFIAMRMPLWICLAIAPFATAQQTPPIHINTYSINVTLDPAHHSMAAQAAVTFTALKDLEAVSFQLNPALRISGMADATGQSLNGGRVSADNSAIRITPSTPLKQGESVTWTFTYSGAFDNTAKENGNTATVQLASIGEPVSYLLYASRWFPTTQSMTDRFTATMHIHVPAGERVFGSGLTGAPHPDENGLMIFDFDWPRPGFPGTIITGRFSEPDASEVNPNVRVYFINNSDAAGLHQQNVGSHSTHPLMAVFAQGRPSTALRSARNDKSSMDETVFRDQKLAAMANEQYSYFTSQFGPADSNRLNVVELPDGTVPAYSAPEIAAVAGRQMRGDDSSRLLANTIAHQWWGNDVSPATRNDAWITNGMCRYAELAYLEHTAKPSVFADAVLNVSASALAYDTVPLANSAHYKPFSTEFQAMTYDKGAMIFRMLRWQIGDAAFQQTLRKILSQHDGFISSAEVEKIAENASHQDLRPFFLQWLDSTGAPTLKDNWTLYRLGNNKGFRTIGEITENLDLFQMPVEVRMESEGKTVARRVDVSGPQTQFTIDTAGMPRNISLDPDRWLLRNDSDMQVRVHILRGQNMAAENDSARAIREYRQALEINSISSLASYRLGEIYFEQRNYQAAADAFRDALHGDDVPKWTEVWSDLKLGEIFDASSQRDRAVNQYREALQTQDDTGGALGVARTYLQHPYQPPVQIAP